MAVRDNCVDHPPGLTSIRIDLLALEQWSDMVGRKFDDQQVSLSNREAYCALTG